MFHDLGSFRMNPHLRTQQLITRNENARVQQQMVHSTQALHRSTSALADEYNEEVTEENIALIRENRDLQAENDRAMTLIRMLADRSEAFQRIAVHLRQSWAAAPTDPSAAPRSVDQPDPQFAATLAEIKQDDDWKNRREDRIQSAVKPVKRPLRR